jgi:hypothetical protein
MGESSQNKGQSTEVSPASCAASSYLCAQSRGPGEGPPSPAGRTGPPPRPASLQKGAARVRGASWRHAPLARRVMAQIGGGQTQPSCLHLAWQLQGIYAALYWPPCSWQSHSYMQRAVPNGGTTGAGLALHMCCQANAAKTQAAAASLKPKERPWGHCMARLRPWPLHEHPHLLPSGPPWCCAC